MTSMMVLLSAVVVLLLGAAVVELVRGNSHLLNFLAASALAAVLASDESVLEASFSDESSLGLDGSEVAVASGSEVWVADGLSVLELSVAEASLSEVFSGADALSVVDGVGSDEL